MRNTIRRYGFSWRPSDFLLLVRGRHHSVIGILTTDVYIAEGGMNGEVFLEFVIKSQF